MKPIKSAILPTIAAALITTLPHDQSAHVETIHIPLELNVKSHDLPYGKYAELLVGRLGVNNDAANDFSEWIHESSIINNVPKTILSSIIMTESSFRYSATSSVGAIGPGQVRPKYWSAECLGDLSKPADNIICSGYILNKYRTNYCSGNWVCAVQAYNVGPTGIKLKKNQGAMKRYLAKVSRYAKKINPEAANRLLASI